MSRINMSQISRYIFVCVFPRFNSTKYTANSTKYMANSTKYTANSTKYMANSTKYTANSTKYTANLTKYTADLTTNVQMFVINYLCFSKSVILGMLFSTIKLVYM